MTLGGADNILSIIDILLCLVDIGLIVFFIRRGREGAKPAARSRLHRKRSRVYSRRTSGRIAP